MSCFSPGGRAVKTIVRTVALLCVAALLAVSGQAADKKEVKKERPKADRTGYAFTFPKQIKLDDKQQEKLNALKQEYRPKLESIHARMAKFMTPERQKAAAAARKAARDAGKKGREIGEAVKAALKFSKEEEAQMREINQEHGKLLREIQQKKLALLTSEQRALLKPKTKDRTEKKDK